MPSVARLEPEHPAAPNLARSAASAGAATMTSRLLGLVRDQVLAALFGAGVAMDAYRVASKIPNLLRDLFAEGAMSAAFVPTFTGELTSGGRASAWRLGNNVLSALIVVTGFLALLGIVFATQLVHAYASGFASVPGKTQLTVSLARIMLPVFTLVALAAAVMGMLNALHHFFVPSVSPALFNVALIAAAFTLVPLATSWGFAPIAGIAVGALIGGVAQLAIQWPTLRREGFRFQFGIRWRDPALHKVLVLMGPGTLGLAATQINLFVNTTLATQQGTGAVSWLDYAFRLMYLPIGLFGVSFATAVLPAVSRYSAARDDAGVRDTVARGLSLMMMLNVPATVGLIILSTPIVELIFERGRFTHADTLATAAALRFYAVGLLGYSVVRIVAPVFYALSSGRTPVAISVATMIVNVAFSVALARGMGFEGLALGTSIAALFNAAVLLFFLRRRLRQINGARLFGALVRIGAASTVMAVAAFVADRGLSTVLPGSALLPQIGRLGGSIGIALVVLAAAAHVLRIREFAEALAMVTNRLRLTGRT